MRFLLYSLCLVCAIPSARAEAPYEIHRLSEREILQTYTNLLWDAFDHSDQFWREWRVDQRAGLWGSGRSDQMNEGIRANSEMIFVSAVLSKYASGAASVKRKAVVDKATAAIRYVVASHLTGSATCTDGKPWGGSWQSAMWTGTMGFGAWLIWDELESRLRTDVERVIESESDRFLSGRPPGGSYNDTKAEENGWNLICLSVAVNMFPQHPHASAWRQKAIEYMVNTLSAPQDRADHTIVDGRPVAEWFSGENVHPDFTLENHGFFHPSYIACSSYFLTQAAMHYTYAHQPIPRAATHHLMETWKMFEGVILPTGESAYPQGMDWELHGLPYINLFASLATYQKDPFAAHMEKTILQYTRAWQKMGHGDLAVPGSKLGFTRHAICAEQAAYGFLAHQLFRLPVKELSASQVEKKVSGVREYNFPQFIAHRSAQKFVSFSWTNRLMGMVIPIGQGHEHNPDFTVPIVNGLIGSFELNPRGETTSVVREHTWKKNGDGFETSGTLLLNGGRLEQVLWVHSIGQRTVLYEDCVTALTNVTIAQEHGIPLGVENDEITGDSRTLSYEGGKTRFDARHPTAAPFTISGDWANVDGRLGIVRLSGGEMAYAQAKDYTPGISVKTDVLYGSFKNSTRIFKRGDEVAHRAALLYVEVSPEKTGSLARSIRIVKGDGPAVVRFKLPEGGTRSFSSRWLSLSETERVKGQTPDSRE